MIQHVQVVVVVVVVSLCSNLVVVMIQIHVAGGDAAAAATMMLYVVLGFISCSSHPVPNLIPLMALGRWWSSAFAGIVMFFSPQWIGGIVQLMRIITVILSMIIVVVVVLGVGSFREIE